jgi:hypothetical protein
MYLTQRGLWMNVLIVGDMREYQRNETLIKEYNPKHRSQQRQ